MKKLGSHEFSGENLNNSCSKTISVGIFEWESNKSFSALKKGKVKVRVSGPWYDKQGIIDQARDICLMLDAGAYTGPKSVTIKSYGYR